jgi:putative ABC transport system substrate-binding protein
LINGSRDPLRDSVGNAVTRSLARNSVEARFEKAAEPEEIGPAISRLAKQGVQALIVLADPLFATERRRIVKLALAQRWPVVAGTSGFAEAGALLNYGVNNSESYRRAAYYVDRILKGTKPGDLPIEQPTKLDLVINMKTAHALGLTITQELRLRADKVIE